MANKRVRLVRSVKIEGKPTFCAPEITPKGSASTEIVKYKGRRLKFPADQGKWYIRWDEGDKPKWQRAASMTEAIGLRIRKQIELQAVAAGVGVIPDKPNRLTFEQAVDLFNDDLRLRDMRTETVEAYRLVFENFKASFAKRYLDQIERRDMLHFAQSMRKAGLAPRTVSNRYLAFSAFLKHHGITGMMRKGDAPKFVEAEPEAYTKEEVTTFLAACTPDQLLLFEFFLKTGARMQEAMFCTWTDFDFKEKTFSVRAKPEHGFRPKSWEERTIPLEEGLAAKLQRVQPASKRSGLVFPTRNGKPNNKMLQACKRIAKRAGLDDSQFWLHKFRATFCTWHADAGVPIPTIQLWMGHKDMATTMRYLRPNRSPEARAKFNATFSGM